MFSIAVSEGSSSNEHSIASLSNRERECIFLLSTGQRTKEIAVKLGISPSAVALYLKNARRKLDAQSHAHLVAKAIFAGLIHPSHDA